MIDTHDVHAPVSRTYAYKKITKPLLERKRRARINRCLEELKDLMVGAFVAEGENISKLEKADILELTVRHLHRLRRTKSTGEEAFRFQAGFSQCAVEACNFLLNLPGVEAHVSRRLVDHLQMVVGPISVQVPDFRLTFSPPVSPADLSRPSASTSKDSSSYISARSSSCSDDMQCSRAGLLMMAVREPEITKKSESDNKKTPECVGAMWRPW